MRVRSLLFACAAALLSSCGGGGGSGDAPPSPPPPQVGQQMADFDLFDDNPASATGGTLVSPRDFLGTASAWYFTRST